MCGYDRIGSTGSAVKVSMHCDGQVKGLRLYFYLYYVAFICTCDDSMNFKPSKSLLNMSKAIK